MKKIEKSLVKFCRFLSEYRPNIFTLFLFLLFGLIVFVIHKHRKKDLEDIREQKAFNQIFNF